MKLKYRKAVFILTYAETKKGIEFLILKRKHHWRGWEFPKGGIEKGETQLQAAKRELHEETGRKPVGKIKKFNYSGRYKYSKALRDRPGYMGQTYSLYAVKVNKGTGKVHLDPLEHSGHRWVSYPEALKRLTWPDQREALRIVWKWLEKKGQTKL